MGRRALRILATVAGVAGLGTLVGRLLGYELGMNTVVRCREGHLYTTIWIPGVKLKGLEFGLARYQYCPVGHHWSIVVPVRRGSLTPAEAAAAAAVHDIWLP